MDLQRLISEVQARPAIWDQRNVYYHNRDVIVKMWIEVARACDVSCDVAKSKWKHLRDNFRNELKKSYRCKLSCDGGSPSCEAESKWIWFKNLLFLRDQMSSRVVGYGNTGSTGQSCHFAASPEETQIEPQIDILEGDEAAHFDDFVDADSCQSMLTGDEILPLNKRSKLGRKRHHMDINDSESQNIERKRYEINQRRYLQQDDNHDDTYHFLMSIRSPLRSLSLERQLHVRIKIQEIIINELSSRAHKNPKNDLLIANIKTENGSVGSRNDEDDRD